MQTQTTITDCDRKIDFDVTIGFTPIKATKDYWNRSFGCWEPGEGAHLEDICVTVDSAVCWCGDYGYPLDLQDNYRQICEYVEREFEEDIEAACWSHVESTED